jgi:hypothetical protein
MIEPIYLQLIPSSPLPQIGDGYFRAVIVSELEVDTVWREQVSKWLIEGGCRYMMAFGVGRDDWELCVDLANLAMFDYGDIPDDGFVMTTSHEVMEEAFWFSEHCAHHPTLELARTFIVHVAMNNQRGELGAAYKSAQSAE